GIRELWELWRRELVEIAAPPPRPNATNYHEARDALDLFHRAVEGLPDDEPSPVPPAVAPAPKRLTVSIECRTVTLDDQTFDVPSAQAVRWLKVLSDHPGEWIAAPELKKYDPNLEGARTDRLKTQLPDPVQALIDSETGKGS